MSFYVLAAYVGFEAVGGLLTGERPNALGGGLVRAAVTLATMPPFAIARGRVGKRLRFFGD